MIKNLLNLLDKKNFKDKNEPYYFSIEIEEYLNKHMKSMMNEDVELAYFLEDELLKICEPMEPGMNGNEFLEDIKKIREHAINKLSHIQEREKRDKDDWIS